MYSALLFVFTLLSGISLGAILLGSDPDTSPFFIRLLFFVTLFFSLVGLFTLLNIWISKLVSRPMPFGTAFRRGSLLSLLSIALILLETFSALNILNALAILVVIVAVEIAAMYRSRKHES
jgi:hypothetical protein